MNQQEEKEKDENYLSIAVKSVAEPNFISLCQGIRFCFVSRNLVYKCKALRVWKNIHTRSISTPPELYTFIERSEHPPGIF